MLILKSDKQIAVRTSTGCVLLSQLVVGQPWKHNTVMVAWYGTTLTRYRLLA